jgi:hypothetical protein
MSASASAVAEIQGLYGPFSFPEKLLQKIWLRGDFARSAAVTTDGRAVRVAQAGKWNRLGGPDFLGARLAFDGGAEITGDIELHLHAGDWVAHAHARDRAYDGVVLHVVLFPPEPGHRTRGAEGRDIPVLVLLPLLHHDLEEFAADEAVESLAGRAAARITEDLAGLPEAELTSLLAAHASSRWRQKVHFARLRVMRLGWEAACHHTALEILGYRFNRAPMLNAAVRWPLVEWAKGSVIPEEVFGELSGSWSLQGVRPANHPQQRLRQYAAWTQARPEWPTAVAALAKEFSGVEPARVAETTREVRRVGRFTALRERLADELCANTVSGTRFDNLICDGVLPLMAAKTAGNTDGLRHGWEHWFVGDLPPTLARGLRDLGVFAAPHRPACHGAAQGLLGWLIEREAPA